MRGSRKHYQIFITLLLIIIGLFTSFPLILAFINSFKSNGELLSNVLSLPSKLYFDNYIRSLEKMSYFRSLGNTVFLAVLAVFFMALFSSLAGWKMCRTKTRLSKFLFAMFVFSMLIPFSSIMIPLYKVVLALGIKNSLIGLALIYAGLGESMAIFIYYGFVKGIPVEMEEAAAIDGCNSIQTFFLVVFPMLKATTATVCITNMLWVWNDFLLPLIIISDNKKYTLLLSTNTLFGQYSSDWTAILSALILAALPAILLYVIFQKNIMKGIADGAVKG
ncbi:raffinose/stachyose/melibiose transport system permease protein [Kineothrix alysoides]|uniref:Raffinose/stachyose/melibiose transport system permease protein n=1 Tax=Kineothrix alysoides TaxID=1469948 RepID=A0A4V2QBC9_9FIRM|nr:carbohydrate ABC transporter permease [Kineothrix alysoides]TCL55872.1 raffinose/stachyose/melibiose transport system permease protein [Kineothrix alysoides]